MRIISDNLLGKSGVDRWIADQAFEQAWGDKPEGAE